MEDNTKADETIYKFVFKKGNKVIFKYRPEYQSISAVITEVHINMLDVILDTPTNGQTTDIIYKGKVVEMYTLEEDPEMFL